MKKIFTFVLGAFMALSASAVTNINLTENLQFTHEGGRWEFYGEDADYAVYVTSAAGDKFEGTYDVSEVTAQIVYKPTYRSIWFDYGTITITKDEANVLHLFCDIIGKYDDGNTADRFLISLDYAEATEALPGDENSDFLINFESYTIDDELADEGMVYVEAWDENRYYVVLEVSLPENATQLVAGTYDVAVVENEDYPYQSITAGSYLYGEPQASFASVLAEDGETIEKVWYIVSGKVFVKANMDIAIAANNSLGKRIAVVLHANSQAVEMTGVATKAIKTIENGMIVIEHNGVRRNVIGQVVR